MRIKYFHLKQNAKPKNVFPSAVRKQDKARFEDI